jgi:hypothetical protein
MINKLKNPQSKYKLFTKINKTHKMAQIQNEIKNHKGINKNQKQKNLSSIYQ